MKIVLLLVLACINFRCLACPNDIAEKLYSHLKTKIQWVDVNSEPNSSTMTIRYYPCFAARDTLDLLISDAMIGITNCKILKPGQHQMVENYCVLREIEFGEGGIIAKSTDLTSGHGHI